MKPLDQFYSPWVRMWYRIHRGLKRQLNLERFLCVHAITVAMHKRFPPCNYCTHCYMANYWTVAYAITIFLPPNEDGWEVFDHIMPLNNLLPPEVGPHIRGRRRIFRIPLTGELSQLLRCKRYSATRHACQFLDKPYPTT